MSFADAFRVIAARRYAVLAVLLVGLIVAAVGARLSHRTYAATASVLMNASSGAGASVSDGGFLSTDMPSLLLSDTVLTRFQQHEHMSGVALRDLRKSIDASVTTESAVMPITYKAGSARGAIEGANTLAELLRAYYREISTRRYDDLAAYLGTALDGERAKIEDTNRQLARLVATDPYFTQRDAAQSIGAQLLALDQQRQQIDATMQSHAVAATLAGQRIGQMGPTIQAELRQASPDYASLAQQVAKDKTAATILGAQYTNKFDGIAALRDQINRSNAVLANERKRAEQQDLGNSPTYGTLLKARDDADAIYAGDKAQIAAIESQIQAATTQLAKIPGVGVKIAALQNDRDAANTAYQILAEQRTLTLSQQAQVAALGSVTIVDRAASAEASIGKGALLLPIATFLGFIVLALALPFGLELIDERLRRRVTIEALYGRPLIGTVSI